MRIKILKICYRKKRKKRRKFVLIPTELGEAFGTERTKKVLKQKRKSKSNRTERKRTSKVLPKVMTQI